MEKSKRKNKITREWILKEVYRHYLDFQDYYMRTGNHIIEIPAGYYQKKYGSTIDSPDIPVTISFLDLQYGFENLTKKRKDAFYYHVIMDMTQVDAGKLMGITTVTIGQYCNLAINQLAKRYFAEFPLEKDTTNEVSPGHLIDEEDE